MPQLNSLRMKAKVCMVGNRVSGKTQLIQPFVLDNFDDRYVQTLGTKVSKKQVRVPNPRDGEVFLDLTVWDVMGQKGFRELLKEAYFYGSRGVLGVCDISRKQTLDELREWIEGVFDVTGPIPVVLAINRKRATDVAEITKSDAERFSAAYGAQQFCTSSETGKHVEDALNSLAVRIARNRLCPDRPSRQA